MMRKKIESIDKMMVLMTQEFHATILENSDPLAQTFIVEETGVVF